MAVAVLLSIGEFSTMTRLSRKALRHYHELGLLEPARIDPVSGYRYYDTAQVRPAQLIRRFRDLDMPVPEVKAVLEAPDDGARDEVVAAHLRRLESQLDRTCDAISALRGLLTSGVPPIRVEFRDVSPVRAAGISEVVGIGGVGGWYRDAVAELGAAVGTAAVGPLHGMYATELFSDDRGAATLYLPVDGEIAVAGRVRVVEIPAARLAVTVHEGTHDRADRTYGALGTYVAERGIGADGPVREVYLGDRMEICWPVTSES
ncbi:MAG: MerR family transcriptional regulator [Umezawaea sp.]